MIKCPNCKAENADGASFCENCGKPLGGQAATGKLDDLSNLNTISGDETQHRNWQASSEEAALEAGTVFADRYTIESIIGRGGMGIVYRARDKIGDREVALKLIRSDRLGGGEQAVQRLLSEGVITQDIRHKNVVAIYNVGQVEDRPFVSMEFVNGVSLREWLRKQVNARVDVPLRVAARIIAEILDGLDAAHAMNIVHRDLKPENVMLTTEPTDIAAPLKILDFGIARAAGNQIESGTGTGLGTPRYMAPEQITNPDGAGPSADLYSLSVIFYELLVDVLPQGHWQPPSGGRADVSPKIDKLIESGLSNRPASRPQSAKEYRAQLVDAVNSPGTVAPPANRQSFVRTNTDTADTTGTGGVGFFKRPWVKYVAIGLGGLFVFGFVINILDGSKPRTRSVETYVPPNTYAALNGRWENDAGAVLNVNVTPSGSFSGQGTDGNDVEVTISGQFNGLSGRFVYSGGNYNYQGTLQRDGRDCDMQIVTYNPDGSISGQGLLHVNHHPNEPCA
ncbi:serine/threonine-protein kinase [uncultured Sphingomonas sp.]|uniref:serine/threonine-protein kinase n=1 Tax=uncultured Sphingomonas sp. TaxID=158754 RepID=UPI0035CBC517